MVRLAKSLTIPLQDFKTLVKFVSGTLGEMLRRSIRLQEAGYYTEEGTPSVSYKEILYRIFRRRKSPNGVQHDLVGDFTPDHQDISNYVDMLENEENIPQIHQPTTHHRGIQATDTWATETTTTRWRTTWKTLRKGGNNGRTSRKFSLRIICSFILFFLLAFGITNYIQLHSEIRELQQELHSLQHQVNMFLPQAHDIPNFALESQGARVLSDKSSDTYWPQENIGILWDRLFSWWCSFTTQRQVIQGHTSLHPGKCWSFSGEQGHLFVFLSHPIYVTHVTLGHIRASQSPSGIIASAPRKFSLHGMTTEDDEGTYLGTWVYDRDGVSFQTFKLADPDVGVFRYVKLQVENNWGNIDNTCVYSFRVHGKLPA
ncbi:SUN domain-containing protein 3-like [Thunnus thynnus]|uniref:SUN domain-containing protein 3-like n=1 Tax=Thunnus thynnus TaxID=8237 RepID=UPI0035285102